MTECLLNYGHQMMHLADHTPDLRSVLFLNHLRDSAEAECFQRAFLVNGVTDLTLDLLDFYFSHVCTSLSSKYFLHRNATVACHCVGIAHLTKGLDSCLHQIVGVGRTL